MRRIAITTCLAGLLFVMTPGPAGAATLAPGSADFGSQAVGTVSAPKAFTLSLGSDPLFSPGITISGPFRQTNNCPALLAPLVASSCTINVTFAPTAAGPQNGTLSSTSVLVGAPTAALTGTGTGSAATAAKQCKKGKKKKQGKKGAVAAKKKGGKKGKCKKKKRKKGGKKK